MNGVDKQSVETTTSAMDSELVSKQEAVAGDSTIDQRLERRKIIKRKSYRNSSLLKATTLVASSWSEEAIRPVLLLLLLWFLLLLLLLLEMIQKKRGNESTAEGTKRHLTLFKLL